VRRGVPQVAADDRFASLGGAMDSSAPLLDALHRRQRWALRLLLIKATAVAGNEVTDPDRAELDSLAARARVDARPEAAAMHRVAGTVLRGLEGVAGIPDDVRAALATRRDQSAMNHLLVVGALREIGRRFDEAGLSWVVMKGPVVATLLYPAVGDRSYSDLDLLVARRDFPRAMAILEDLGYAHDIHNWALAEEMLAGQVGMATRTVHIDLHWHLHYSEEDRKPFAFPIETMIERGRRVSVSGVETPTLDPVDTLLTLAFHAARSDGHRLMWFKDVERSAVVDEPDLDELVRRARAYRCGGPVGLILNRARYLLGAPVPLDVVLDLMPRSLRIVDDLATRAENPLQLHERITVTRWFTRSVRASVASSALAVPQRAARSLHRTLRPPPENETDDPAEKAGYLRAVAGSERQ
jgi:hypothetical protein